MRKSKASFVGPVIEFVITVLLMIAAVYLVAKIAGIP